MHKGTHMPINQEEDASMLADLEEVRPTAFSCIGAAILIPTYTSWQNLSLALPYGIECIESVYPPVLWPCKHHSKMYGKRDTDLWAHKGLSIWKLGPLPITNTHISMVFWRRPSDTDLCVLEFVFEIFNFSKEADYLQTFFKCFSVCRFGLL